jgi:Ser/Thr protein kinase RdoA (MazF antagonist)
VIKTAEGANWAEQDGQRILVTRWEPGDYRRYDTYSAAEWVALGRCLASLHLRLDEVTAPLLETLSLRLRRIAADVELARLELRDQRIPTHSGIDRPWVIRYLAICRDMFTSCYAPALEAFPVEDPEHPIHNDFNQFNYLFGPTLPPLILDWEASIGAPREFEVVRCLNHLPLQDAALARSFLAGYLSIRRLRAERMRWAIDVSCLMHATKHWVLEGWIAGRPGFEERLRGAMEMVSMLARERDGLGDFFIRCIGDAS